MSLTTEPSSHRVSKPESGRKAEVHFEHPQTLQSKAQGIGPFPTKSPSVRQLVFEIAQQRAPVEHQMCQMYNSKYQRKTGVQIRPHRFSQTKERPVTPIVNTSGRSQS